MAMRTEQAAKPRLMAYAWANGVIEFGYGVPDGALPIACSRDERRLRDVVDARARHSRTSSALIVPGVPEAADPNSAVDALKRFSNQILCELEG
jgi:hypothetical protein